MPGDIPAELYKIWTNKRVSEQLDTLYTWSYGQVMRANEWLDALDDAEYREQQKAAKQK